MEGKGENEGTAPMPPPATPGKKPSGIIIAIAVIVVVALLVAALVILLPYATQPPIVGKWHITEEKYIENDTTYNSTVNQYMVFNADGTGYIYDTMAPGEVINFTWKDLGNSSFEMTHKEGSMKVTITISYEVNGDKITLTYRYEGGKVEAYGERVESLPPMNLHHVNSWEIKINGKMSKVIKATTQGDGTATWSGWVNVTVYDENGHPLPSVKVILDGRGIVEAGMTNESGSVAFHVQGVTLPSNVQQDEIMVKLQYGGETKTDTLTVIRVS